MTEQETLLAEITELADAIDAMAEGLAALHMRRNAVLAAANDSGVTVVQLAKTARLARPTVYASMKLGQHAADDRLGKQLALFAAVTPEVAGRVTHVGHWLTVGGRYAAATVPR